jgi:hypothetical protein
MNYKKIKTFEDACKAVNVDPTKLPDVSMLTPGMQKFIMANYKLSIIAEALNEGKKADWFNWDEYKYFPWFEINADESNRSGVGFSDSDYVLWRTFTGVGSRLSFRSRELALYAGKQFEELYKDLILHND